MHFGNPKLHNNLLASQHPNVGRCSDIGSAPGNFGPNQLEDAKDNLWAMFAEVSCLRLAVKKLVILSFTLVLCLGYAPTATATSKSAKGHHKSKRKASWKKKGQQGIKSERAMEIQQALIREKYLTGEPTGTWDARTQAALVKYQGDNGWQTKVVPDSRALIKLGLGPNYSAELLNTQPKASPAGTPSTTASRGIEGTAGKQ
ncbi:MAG: Peptidoglycan-binding domain 1 protein [Candidatus Angelobacter sp.]|nr:Peptidoglycan-binding domain 1 protein [Candidatus Angelobacter sp.]